HTNIATFGRVEYDDVYHGVDLVYYGKQQQLEYDFVVAPGAEPSAIRLNVSGAERLEIDPAGNLVVYAGGQQLRQHKPFTWQDVGGVRRENGQPVRAGGGWRALRRGRLRHGAAVGDRPSPYLLHLPWRQRRGLGLRHRRGPC